MIPRHSLGIPDTAPMLPMGGIKAAGRTFSPKEVKAILDALAKMGRGKDSIIAQINPAEAKALKKRGGTGRINPKTGLVSFDDGGGGDDGGSGDDGGGDSGSDSGGSDSGGGGNDSGGSDAGGGFGGADGVGGGQDASSDSVAAAADTSGSFDDAQASFGQSWADSIASAPAADMSAPSSSNQAGPQSSAPASSVDFSISNADYNPGYNSLGAMGLGSPGDFNSGYQGSSIGSFGDANPGAYDAAFGPDAEEQAASFNAPSSSLASLTAGPSAISSAPAQSMSAPTQAQAAPASNQSFAPGPASMFGPDVTPAAITADPNSFAPAAPAANNLDVSQVASQMNSAPIDQIAAAVGQPAALSESLFSSPNAIATDPAPISSPASISDQAASLNAASAFGPSPGAAYGSLDAPASSLSMAMGPTAGAQFGVSGPESTFAAGPAMNAGPATSPGSLVGAPDAALSSAPVGEAPAFSSIGEQAAATLSGPDATSSQFAATAPTADIVDNAPSLTVSGQPTQSASLSTADLASLVADVADMLNPVSSAKAAEVADPIGEHTYLTISNAPKGDTASTGESKTGEISSTPSTNAGPNATGAAPTGAGEVSGIGSTGAAVSSGPSNNTGGPSAEQVGARGGGTAEQQAQGAAQATLDELAGTPVGGASGTTGSSSSSGSTGSATSATTPANVSPAPAPAAVVAIPTFGPTSQPSWNQGPASVVAPAMPAPSIRTAGIGALAGSPVTPSQSLFGQSAQPAPPVAVQQAARAADRTNYAGKSYTAAALSAPVATKAGLSQQTMADVIVAARNILGEARNQRGPDGSLLTSPGAIAVAAVQANRAAARANSGARGGSAGRGSIAAQGAAANQFSWQNDRGDPRGSNRAAVAAAEKGNTKDWQDAVAIAQGVISGAIADPTNGANHYATTATNPSWARNKDMARGPTIGDHVFYTYAPWANRAAGEVAAGRGASGAPLASRTEAGPAAGQGRAGSGLSMSGLASLVASVASMLNPIGSAHAEPSLHPTKDRITGRTIMVDEQGHDPSVYDPMGAQEPPVNPAYPQSWYNTLNANQLAGVPGSSPVDAKALWDSQIPALSSMQAPLAPAPVSPPPAPIPAPDAKTQIGALAAPAKADEKPQEKPQDKAAKTIVGGIANAALAPFGLPGMAANLATSLTTGKSIGAHVADYLDPKAGDPNSQLDLVTDGGGTKLPSIAYGPGATDSSGGTPVKYGSQWARNFIGITGDPKKYGMGPQQSYFDAVNGTWRQVAA